MAEAPAHDHHVADACAAALARGDYSRAAAIAVRRGDIGTAVGLLQQAGHIEEAAHCAAEHGDVRASQLWRDVADACSAAADRDGVARAAFASFWYGCSDEGVLERPDGSISDWTPWQALIATHCASLYSDSAAAMELGQHVIAAAAGTGDMDLEAIALYEVGLAQGFCGDARAAEQSLRDAIGLHDAAQRSRWSMSARIALIEVLSADVRDHDALSEADELLALAQRTPNASWNDIARISRTLALLRTGNVRAALEAAPTPRRTTPGMKAASDPYAPGIAAVGVKARLEAGRTTPDDVTVIAEAAARCRELDSLSLAFECELIAWRMSVLSGTLDAQQPALIDDVTACARLAMWNARYGVVLEHGPFIERAREILNTIDEAPTALCERAVAEATAACDADTTALIDIAQQWEHDGRSLDALRALLSTGALLTVAGRNAAAQALIDRARDLAMTSGAGGDATLIDRLRGLDSLTSAAADHGFAQLLNGLDADARDTLYAHITSARYEQGEVVCDTDAATAQLFVVRRGSVRLVRPAVDGKHAILHFAGAGEVFGGAAFAEDISPQVEAIALEPCVIAAIDVQVLRRLAERSPVLSRNLVTMFAQQLERSQRLASDLAHRTIEQRVAQALLNLDDDYGRASLQEGRIVAVPLTQQDIADLVGAARPRVAQVMARMRRDGLIDRKQQLFVVRDRDALAHLAGDHIQA